MMKWREGTEGILGLEDGGVAVLISVKYFASDILAFGCAQ
jgi:hypothetical protein